MDVNTRQTYEQSFGPEAIKAAAELTKKAADHLKGLPDFQANLVQAKAIHVSPGNEFEYLQRKEGYYLKTTSDSTSMLRMKVEDFDSTSMERRVWQPILTLKDQEDTEDKIKWTISQTSLEYPGKISAGFSKNGSIEEVTQQFEFVCGQTVDPDVDFKFPRLPLSRSQEYYIGKNDTGKNVWIVKDAATRSLQSGQAAMVRERIENQPLEKCKIKFEFPEDDIKNHTFFGMKKQYLNADNKLIFVARDGYKNDSNRYIDITTDENVPLTGVPEKTDIELHNNDIIVSLNQSFGDFSPGSVIAKPYHAVNDTKVEWNPIHEQDDTKREFFKKILPVGDGVLLLLSSAVGDRLFKACKDAAGKTWSRQPVPIPGDPTDVTISLESLEDAVPGNGGKGDYCVTYEHELRPPISFKKNIHDETIEVKIDETPALFDAEGMSRGTIPYHAPDGAEYPIWMAYPKGYERGQARPVLCDPYGHTGSKDERLYNPIYGKLWLERGGIWARPLLPGGIEFGEKQNLSGKGRNKINNPKAYNLALKRLFEAGIATKGAVVSDVASAAAITATVAAAMEPAYQAAIYIRNGVLDLENSPFLYKSNRQKVNLENFLGEYRGKMEDPTFRATDPTWLIKTKYNGSYRVSGW